MKIKLSKNKLSNAILVILFAALSTFYCISAASKGNVELLDDAGQKKKMHERIKTIQYMEEKETYGEKEGKSSKSTYVTYSDSDRLRLETNSNGKTVEIYNGTGYIYYDDMLKRIKFKECFPIGTPEIVEISEEISRVLNIGDYEFFGYEEHENKKLMVIGVVSESDGHNYMHKYWIETINNVILPFREEYFIDNSVVEKTNYTYTKVNKPINDELFEIATLPKVEVVNDGFLPKYVGSIKEAERYINFIPLEPCEFPGGAALSEISVIPPQNEAKLRCVFSKSDDRIYLYESKGSISYIPNALLGKIPCSYSMDNSKARILWRQSGIYLIIEGNTSMLSDVIYLAESISRGNFIK